MIFLKKDEECSCSSASNTKHICVVENIEDAIKIQNTHSYDGLYHVLGGAISPLDGIGPKELNMDSLIGRAQSALELIIATDASVEGDTTALYISKILPSFQMFTLK